jgi:hypothetical protein
MSSQAAEPVRRKPACGFRRGRGHGGKDAEMLAVRHPDVNGVRRNHARFFGAPQVFRENIQAVHLVPRGSYPLGMHGLLPLALSGIIVPYVLREAFPRHTPECRDNRLPFRSLTPRRMDPSWRVR